MDKYFSSTYQSGIVSSKPYSSFSSMIVTSPKQKPKDLVTSQKSFHDKNTSERPFAFKKELNKTGSFLNSSDRTTFKSV